VNIVEERALRRGIEIEQELIAECLRARPVHAAVQTRFFDP
jgi:hypothetical protein